jgi:hypothetical protein
MTKPCSLAVCTKKSVSRLTFARENVRRSIAEYNALAFEDELEVGGDEGSGRRERSRDAYCSSALSLKCTMCVP